MSRRMPTPPKIGSPKWDHELAAIGVNRHVVDEELAMAIRIGETGTGNVDPHSMMFLCEPTQTAAAWILLHQDHPSYDALMYVRHIWFDANDALRGWIVRQFAAMLVHGPRPVAESGAYGLWVDYFETRSDAADVFASLAAQMPHSRWHRLLSAAGPVPWAAKRARFLEAAEIPALHAALAEGIEGSFYDIYGDVDAVEAALLLERITVADADLRAALVEVTTQPLRRDAGAPGDSGPPTRRTPSAAPGRGGSEARGGAGGPDLEVWPRGLRAHVDRGGDPASTQTADLR